MRTASRVFEDVPVHSDFGLLATTPPPGIPVTFKKKNQAGSRRLVLRRRLRGILRIHDDGGFGLYADPNQNGPTRVFQLSDPAESSVHTATCKVTLNTFRRMRIRPRRR